MLAAYPRQHHYYPIFRIASDLLLPIADSTANAVLNRLAQAASDLAGLGATTLHDLSGRMFQRLIADRKFLATFYTLPTSAALLGELAVSRLDAVTDWSNPDALTRLQVADLACGTGTLLSAAYRALASRHRRTGGDDQVLHTQMMERALIAADIMPAATHLPHPCCRVPIQAQPLATLASTLCLMDNRARKSGTLWPWVLSTSLKRIPRHRCLGLASM